MSEVDEGENTYTVGCALRKLMLREVDVFAIEEAVHRVHLVVILGTELANLLARRWIEAHDVSKLAKLFDANFLCKLFNAVSCGRGKEKAYDEMAEVCEVVEKDMLLKRNSLPLRTGLTQCLGYEARSLSTVAKNNVWMHFGRRVQNHVRNYLQKAEGTSVGSFSQALVHQLTIDVLRTPAEDLRSPACHHDWIDSTRRRLGLHDLFVNPDLGEIRPIAYHLKKSPHLFLAAMDLMCREREQRGQSTFAIFPLRRALTPRHIHLDEKCLRDLLHKGTNPHHLLGKREGGEASTSNASETKKRVRRCKEKLSSEKQSFFADVVNLRACRIRHPENFAFHLTTDGVCARVLMRRVVAANSAKRAKTTFPTRGMWCIDTLKEEARKNRTELHVVGVDPGKRELVVAVDMDELHEGTTRRDKKGVRVVRYTQKQRAFETRCVEYNREIKNREARAKELESTFCGTNSRSPSFTAFREYVHARRRVLQECLELHAHVKFRRRRWKTSIKTQQSEAWLFNRLRALHPKGDPRTMVLAYGSWGLVAGRATLACNKGNPPCIGVGLMRKLAKHFVVSPTPEAYTSKTCCKCLGVCGPCVEVDSQRVKEGKKKVRGLRRCQNEECMIFLNRDRNAAINIGTNFKRLFEGEGPIRRLSDEEIQFTELSVLNSMIA